MTETVSDASGFASTWDVDGIPEPKRRRKEYIGWVAKLLRGGYWHGYQKPGGKRGAMLYATAAEAVRCIEDQAKAVRLYRWVEE